MIEEEAKLLEMLSEDLDEGSEELYQPKKKKVKQNIIIDHELHECVTDKSCC